MMKTKLITLMMLSTLLLAACGTPASPPTAPTRQPDALPTQAPSMLPTQAPSVLPTQPPSPLPTVQPGSGLVTQPEADVWKNAPAAALAARADLAKRLQIDPDTIKLVGVEQIDWPDACLGIHQPDVMCAQVITTGYKVVLEANGKQYEYHTNESGSVVRLVEA